jgi:hypothetical protein
MTEEDEQDKRVQEEIHVHTVRYQQAKDTFQTAKNLVERWAKRVPEFGKLVVGIDVQYRSIKIRDVGPEDGENKEGVETEHFQVFINEAGGIDYLFAEYEGDEDSCDTAEGWLAEVESAVAKRIAWLQAVKGENRAKASKRKSKA